MNKKVIILSILFAVIFAIILILYFYPSIYKGHAPDLATAAYEAEHVKTGEIILDPVLFENGWPSETRGDTIISYTGFTLSYDEEEEQAAWVAYILTAREVESGNTERTDNFRSDRQIRTGSASPDDYRASGYDRGHLAPAADMAWSADAMSESFFMSNMSPQVPAFNRGIWKKLETAVRDWAVSCDSVYVISGPVLNNVEGHIGTNNVGIPGYYFKVILDLSPPNKMIAFLLPNAASKESVYRYAISVDSLEAYTGYDFFAGVNDQRSISLLESQADTTSWLSN